MSQAAYKRILLKISGEVLAGDQSFGIDSRMIEYIASEIAEVAAMGVEVAVVIGGGDIYPGVDAAHGGMGRGPADYMGMLAPPPHAPAPPKPREKQGTGTPRHSRLRIAP